MAELQREYDLPFFYTTRQCWTPKEESGLFSLGFFHEAAGIGSRLMMDVCALEQ